MVNVGVIINKGFEKVAVAQIRELIDKPGNIVVDNTFVSFNTDSWDDTYRFIYMNQIANRVAYFISKIEYSDDDDMLSKIRQLFTESFKDELLMSLIAGGADFRVTLRTDEHTDVTWLESEIGEILIDYAKMHGYDLKVNLKNPVLNFYVHIHNDVAYLCVDLSGDLSKRDYKIFNNAVSLKGPTAFGLFMIAGCTPKDVYVNPCCYSGTMEIEAALYFTGTSHRYYNKSFPFMKFPSNADSDWDRFFRKIDDNRITPETGKGKFSITGSDKLLSSITASVKNAKIAGMESFIDFRRIDMDWVDIKFEEKSVDKIVSFIPGSSKHDKGLPKEFKQLFYQAEYVLKDSGAVIIMCLSKELLIEASKEYLELDHEAMTYSGNQVMHILFFKKR